MSDVLCLDNLRGGCAFVKDHARQRIGHGARGRAGDGGGHQEDFMNPPS
jgi:hypothetical protein